MVHQCPHVVECKNAFLSTLTEKCYLLYAHADGVDANRRGSHVLVMKPFYTTWFLQEFDTTE